MAEFIIDYSLKADMTDKRWRLHLTRGFIREAKELGMSQSQALIRANRKLKAEGYNAISLSGLKYYWQ